MSGANPRRFASVEMRGGIGSDDQEVLQQISTAILEIGKNTNLVKQMTNSIGTSKDSEDVRQRMRSMITQTSHIANQVTHDFKSLDHIDRGSDKQKKLQKSKLWKDFSAIAANFKQISTLALQKEKQTPAPQPTFVSRNDDRYYDDEEERRHKEMENRRLLDERFQAVEQDRVFHEDAVARRNQEIKEIEKAVIEVNEMFVDVAQLVAEQGQMIDTIESHVEQTNVQTKAAVGELKKASEYQKSSRSKLCVLVLIIMVIAGGAAIAIWLFVSPPGSKKETPTEPPTSAPTPTPTEARMKWHRDIQQYINQQPQLAEIDLTVQSQSRVRRSHKIWSRRQINKQ